MPNLKKTLVIDRSSTLPSFALFEATTLLCQHQWNGEPTRAPEWLAEVRTYLTAQQISFEAIDQYVCGLGPGSFSGIRACLAAILGLALPTKTPVYGVASAAAIASALPDACVTVEQGVDGILMNTAIAEAADPVRMARAMKLAVEAGRHAFLAGRMPRRETAVPSSPLTGMLG